MKNHFNPSIYKSGLCFTPKPHQPHSHHGLLTSQFMSHKNLGSKVFPARLASEKMFFTGNAKTSWQVHEGVGTNNKNRQKQSQSSALTGFLTLKIKSLRVHVWNSIQDADRFICGLHHHLWDKIAEDVCGKSQSA